MKRASLLLLAALLSGCSGCDTNPPAPAEKPEPERPRNVREPASAGQFYPGDPGELRRVVDRLLAAGPRVTTARVPVVLTPHAGLGYSGGVAAASLRELPKGFKRAVILAANHNGKARFSGAAVDAAHTHYRVPGLEVKVDAKASELATRPGFVDVPAAHGMHMIEIELPFLHAASGGPFTIIPLIVGHLDRDGARALAAELAKLADPETVFVFSVDLSHYYTYDQAVALDKPCLAALGRADLEGVARCDTDGTQVLLTMHELAARLGLAPRLLAYQNSGDTSGDHGRVVGYGALVYEDRFQLGEAERGELLKLARRAVEEKVKSGNDIEPPAELLSRLPRLATPRGAFVTLRKAGALRGCIGSLAPVEPLARDVVKNAVNAALKDTRFSPVDASELSAIDVSISVLDLPRPSPPMPPEAILRMLGETHPGVVLKYQGRRSTFLPSVWEELPGTEQFLGALCAKQGSPRGCWREPEARFELYGAQHFGERPPG